VRIIEALYRSTAEGRAIEVEQVRKFTRPTASQDIERSPVEEPELVHAESPHH
jgi:hypothetical protein